MNTFEAAGIVIPGSLAEQIQSMVEVWEAIKAMFYQSTDNLADLAAGLYIPEEPTPKTPYFYNSKIWIHDKRPGQHHIRNNCRKDR